MMLLDMLLQRRIIVSNGNESALVTQSGALRESLREMNSTM